MILRSTVAALCLSATACTIFNEPLEPLPEHDAITCTNGQDDDFDGLLDCGDLDCLGFCPEDDPASCSDELDNDGDGQTDEDDARCWPGAEIFVERCVAAEAIDLFEDFDGQALRGFSVDGSIVSLSTLGSWPRWQGEGRALLYDPASLEPTKLISLESFHGSWDGLELSGAFYLLDQSVAPTFVLGLAPREQVLRASDVAAVNFDGNGSVSLTVEGTSSTS